MGVTVYITSCAFVEIFVSVLFIVEPEPAVVDSPVVLGLSVATHEKVLLMLEVNGNDNVAPEQILPDA